MGAKVLIIRGLEACNAGCFMCEYAFSKDDFRLTRESFSKILSDIDGSDIRLLRLTGGEPLLLDDLPIIIKDIKRSGRFSSIITNGWHIPEKFKILVEAGLDQIIVSVDGPDSKSHDKFRKLPGLFENIFKGVSLLHEASPSTITRVNTVVGAHNIHKLVELWELLRDKGIKQWSLIPLKRSGGAWGSLSLNDIETNIISLQNKVKEDQLKYGVLIPQILGYGLNVFGRTPQERQTLWHEGRAMTPVGKCHLVDQVLYYTPKQGSVYPCNCIPHRNGEIAFSDQWSVAIKSAQPLANARAWLRDNGSTHCRGCEPINAALGDYTIDLDHDIFGF